MLRILINLKTFKMEKQNIIYAGSHPDSLYRVSGNNGGGADKAVRALRMLRWPLALFTVCVALAVFVYFLMPVNLDTEIDTVNATFWEESISEAQSHRNLNKIDNNPTQRPVSEKSHSHGTKTPEIDFYDSDNKNYDPTIVDIVTEISEKRKLPAPPVFPTYIAPEVQYGNEKADSDQPRSPKLLKVTTTVPSDSTLKPHITQKPEKPLAIYFKEGNALSTTNAEPPITESITHAETSNDIAQFLKQQGNKIILEYTKPQLPIYRDIQSYPALQKFNKPQVKQNFDRELELSPEIQEYSSRTIPNNNVKFTSGHSMLFGISIEDSQNMKSTTQNSLYNTRVSPTLPTWRDRDDTTTKKYPINGNIDVAQCRSTHLDICRGVLPYDLAGAPATVGDVDVTTLLPQIEYLVSTNCSQRIRHFACALLEPECSPPPYSPKLPCYNFCKAIVDSCDGMIPTELQQMFECNRYSSSNCANARVPCFTRELACGDGSCVPRDWVCDGTRDCADGEDEAPCASCEESEYRCSSGLCIAKRWLCDGYSDCPSGEDELEELCSRRTSFQGVVADEVEVGEPGEEIAGSAPAPSIRKPNRLIDHERSQGIRNGENDSSKEILMTSDSNNAFRRNFTRRPSPSRLTPYKRPKLLDIKPATESEETIEATTTISIRKIMVDNKKNNRPIAKNEDNNQKNENKDSAEDVNAEDLGLFGDIEKEKTENKEKVGMQQNRPKPNSKSVNIVPGAEPTRLDKTMNNLERVIDGAAMIRKATRENQEKYDSPEVNITLEKIEDNMGPYNSAHASPCPSGELRCVDGRCITLAQLCDGTIDCSDHADEDNCYT